MHYFQKNIADYRKDTGHLSLLEHGIYNQLMDTYYLDEKPIETQQVIRRLSIKTEEEKLALDNVLNDFFQKSQCGKYWVQGRIESEIEKYKAKAETAKANGSKGGRPKKPKKTQPVNLANPEKTGSKANHKPLTNNQEPLNINNMFERFWEAGMVKTNKKKALPIFKKIIQSQKDPESFTDKLVFDIGERLRLGQCGFENMHPTTYLDNERWDDEIKSPLNFGGNHANSGFSKPSKQTPEQRITAQIKQSQLEREASRDHGALLASDGSVIPAQVDFDSGRLS